MKHMLRPRFYTGEDAELFLGVLYQQARDNFSVFRRLIRPTMQWNWWTEEIARDLQQFRADLIAGKRPILAIQAPPQHGKSEAASDFIAWCGEWRRRGLKAKDVRPLGARSSKPPWRPILKRPSIIQKRGRERVGLTRWRWH